ncbi:hypothetical protein FF1_014513 [Malus domestica]
MLARACDSLSTEHWPLAMETFPARVKRDEHQKIVERSWSKGRPKDESMIQQLILTILDTIIGEGWKVSKFKL